MEREGQNRTLPPHPWKDKRRRDKDRFLFLSFSLSPPRRWLVLFGSVPVLPAFLLPFFFLSLIFFLSFLLSFFPRPGGDWALFCSDLSPSFLLPSFLCLSFFLPRGRDVLFCCPRLSVFPSFPFLPLVVLSSLLPSAGGWLGTFLFCPLLSLVLFRSYFLSPPE